MLGTITNCCTILTGSVIGATLHKGIKEEYQETMMNGLGLAALALGINNFAKAMPNSKYPVLFIFSIRSYYSCTFVLYWNNVYFRANSKCFKWG